MRPPRRPLNLAAAWTGLTAAGALFVVALPAAAEDVLTSRGDDARTGASLHETLLSPQNVNKDGFGRLFAYDVNDGSRPGTTVEVYAQPLYVHRVPVAGRGLVNLLLVATDNDFVYALDADGPLPGRDGVLWKRQLGRPPSMDDVKKKCDPVVRPCIFIGANTAGNLGIMSTPVIDRGRGIVYLMARVFQPPDHVAYHLHALDLRTGADRAASPVEVRAQASGVVFEPDYQNQRTGLALSRGQVVVAWGSYADVLPYRGWVLSYRYDDVSGFALTGAFVTTPDGDTSATCAQPPGPAGAAVAAAQATMAVEIAAAALDFATGNPAGGSAHVAHALDAWAAVGAAARAEIPVAANNCAHGGIWMAGRAPAVDANGDVLLMVGNGKNDMSATATRNFGNSLVRLDPVTLAVKDFFTPANHLMINAADLDLGGSGPMIIPGSNFVVGGGKEGVMHVWRSDNLGRFSPTDASVVQKFMAGDASVRMDTGNDMPAGAVVGGWIIGAHPGHIMAGPVYWPRPASAGGSRLFNWSENSELRSYAVDPAATPPIALPAVKGPDVQAGHPGGILTLSANEADPDSGVVWAATYGTDNSYVPTLGVTGALNKVQPGTLRAYDARNLHALWTSDMKAGDTLGLFAKFTPPTVANGRVYMATFSGLVQVYGLSGFAYPRPSRAMPFLSVLLDEDP